MTKMGFVQGTCLGKLAQGITEAIQPSYKFDSKGLVILFRSGYCQVSRSHPFNLENSETGLGRSVAAPKK